MAPFLDTRCAHGEQPSPAMSADLLTVVIGSETGGASAATLGDRWLDIDAIMLDSALSKMMTTPTSRSYPVNRFAKRIAAALLLAALAVPAMSIAASADGGSSANGNPPRCCL